MRIKPRTPDNGAAIASDRKKVALIIGVDKPAGSYLAEFLLQKGYVVYGAKRRTSILNVERITPLYQAQCEAPQRFLLCNSEPTDSNSIFDLIEKSRPDELYNFSSYGEAALLSEEPEYVANVNAIGPLRLLEAIRKLGLQSKTRFYQAFPALPYEKNSIFPNSGIASISPHDFDTANKIYAYWLSGHYRDTYGIYACNGILVENDAFVRPEFSVARKITRGLIRIVLGLQSCLHLGNLNINLDWGQSSDYAELQWRMLQQAQPEDLVLATGIQRSVRDFVEIAASELGISLFWKGKGLEEIGMLLHNGPYKTIRRDQIIVRVDSRYFSPGGSEIQLNDINKMHQKLGWKPVCTFHELVKEWINSDLAAYRSQTQLRQNDAFQICA